MRLFFCLAWVILSSKWRQQNFYFSWELNPGPLNHESSGLTTRPGSIPIVVVAVVVVVAVAVAKSDNFGSLFEFKPHNAS